MVINNARAKLNLPLNLAPNSVLYNVLTGNGCNDINEVTYQDDLETLFNDLLTTKETIDENPRFKKYPEVQLFIGETLNKILDCLPLFIGGLIFYKIRVDRDKEQIIWDISELKIFFE